MQKQTRIPKETAFQKWIEECVIFSLSEDIEIGKLYDGYGATDGETVAAHLKPIYYDTARKSLLAEDTNNKQIIILRGRMYAYQNRVFSEEYSHIMSSEALCKLLDETILRLKQAQTPLIKTTLAMALQEKYHPKVRGCFISATELIADAYFSGSITTSNSTNNIIF